MKQPASTVHLGRSFSGWPIFLPAPLVVAIDAYVLLLSWNDYLYALAMLPPEDQMTELAWLNDFLNSDFPSRNLPIAAGPIYALPPVEIVFLGRQFLISELESDGVKG